MNKQTNMAATAAADLVRQIAKKLYGADGAEITDLIALANRVLANARHPASASPAAAIDRFDLQMAMIGGCTDGACVIVKPRGMHTNGGCTCMRDPLKFQRLAVAAQQLRAEVATSQPHHLRAGAEMIGAGNAVAWYVFADTEHWVTMDADEADENREDGCQVRPLVFGEMHAPPSPQSSGNAGELSADTPAQVVSQPKSGEVYVEVSGLTGSGKSGVAGEIEILCKALGLDVEWVNGDEEKRLTHADWTEALEMYKPKVVIIERNIPHPVIDSQEAK